MGKSLLELLENFDERSSNQLAYNKEFDPTTIVSDTRNRNETELSQVGNFIKNVPQIYGLDSKRILLQRDPHEDKITIKQTAGQLGSLLGPVGASVGNFLADFNPKYPDDFLVGDTTEPKFNLYSNLISSDYAGGKYYNGGVKNSKSKLGSFLQTNKTPQQIKDNAVAAAKTMIVGAAIAGVKGLFRNKKNKQRDDQSKRLPTPVPFFPSTLILNSNTTLSESDLVANFQEQQRNNPLFPTKFGKDLGITQTISKDELLKRDDDLANLDTLYSNHIERYLRKNNETDKRELYDNYGYYTSLTINNGVEDSYKRIGRYSKDVLRIFKPADNTNGEFVPESWDRYPTIREFEDANPNWDNLIPTEGLLKFGTDNVSSPQTGGEINLVSSSLDNWLGYKAIGEVDYSKYWIKPVRWNGREAKYSNQTNETNLNKILDQDYYFASQSFQSQTNSFTKKYNPYLQQKRDVLDTSNNGVSKNSKAGDRIKFKIGGVVLLATLSGLTDATTPTWSEVKGVGSGFSFYGYDRWEREISFKFRLYAESEKDMQDIWKKANFIKQYTLPIAKGNLGVYGKIIPLQIGDLINEEHGFLTLCEISVLDESPWEITEGLQKPFVFDVNITYKTVRNEDNFEFYKPQADKKAYEIQTKPQSANSVVIGAPPQIPVNTQTDDQLDSSPIRTTDTTTINRQRSSTQLNTPTELNRTPTTLTPKRAPDTLNQKFGLGEVTTN